MISSVHVKNGFVYMGGNSSPPSKFTDSTKLTNSTGKISTLGKIYFGKFPVVSGNQTVIMVIW